MNKFGICDKCKSINIKSLVPKLKQIDDEAIIDIRCQNFCGIGRNRPFCIVNNKVVIATNESELIEKVKNSLK